MWAETFQLKRQWNLHVKSLHLIQPKAEIITGQKEWELGEDNEHTSVSKIIKNNIKKKPTHTKEREGQEGEVCNTHSPTPIP